MCRFRLPLLVLGEVSVGVWALLCSATGLCLRLTGVIPPTAGVLDYTKLSLLAWVAMFFTCGWIARRIEHAGRPHHDSRMMAGVMAVLMMPVGLVLTFGAIAIPLVQGTRVTFRSIRKTGTAR